MCIHMYTCPLARAFRRVLSLREARAWLLPVFSAATLLHHTGEFGIGRAGFWPLDVLVVASQQPAVSLGG